MHAREEFMTESGAIQPRHYGFLGRDSIPEPRPLIFFR